MKYVALGLLGILTMTVGAEAETAYVRCPSGVSSLPVFANLSHGSGGKLVANLNCGEAVNVIQEDRSWAKIRLWNGKTAYASSLFLAATPAPNATAAAAEPVATIGPDGCRTGTHRITTGYGSFCGTGQSDVFTQKSPGSAFVTSGSNAESNQLTFIEMLMTPSTRVSTGVSRLTFAQRTELSKWLSEYTQTIMASSTPAPPPPPSQTFNAAPAPVIQSRGTIESQIDGEFHGWSGDTIFKLTNGQIWQQSEYDYEYDYEYMPDVVIYWASGCYKLKVEGVEDTICVKRIK